MDRLKRPMLFRLIRRIRAGIEHLIFRPRCAAFHPIGERGDFGLGERLFGRHFHIACVPHRLDQQAFLGIAGHYDRSIVAAAEKRLATIKPQAHLLLFGPVTFLATSCNERPHVSFEEIGPNRTRCHRHRNGRSVSRLILRQRARHGDEHQRQRQ